MAMRFRFVLSLSFLLFPTFGFTQDYLWPTDASRYLTSSFGEYRPGHFHSGIDIKTWGKEGYKALAVRDGYIWRVRVSPYGFGKVIYQKLDTGEIAVYAHLKKFYGPLERWVKKEQRRRGRYSLEAYFSPRDFPVRQGQLIAYTGSTGVGFPHLHFELRDENNEPFNPLSKVPWVRDTTSPTLLKLAILPFGYESQVDGSPLPQIYELVEIQRGDYFIRKPIQVWGAIGLALAAFDRVDGTSHRLSPYQLRLTLDDREIFASTYRRFPFSKTRQVELDRNFRLNRWGRGLFYNLFILPGNNLPFYNLPQTGQGLLVTQRFYLEPETNVLLEPFPFVRPTDWLKEWRQPSRLGLIYVTSGVHSFRITASDYFGNVSSLSGELVVRPRKVLRHRVVVGERVLRVERSSEGNSLAVFQLSRDYKTWHRLSRLQDLSINGDSQGRKYFA